MSSSQVKRVSEIRNFDRRSTSDQLSTTRQVTVNRPIRVTSPRKNIKSKSRSLGLVFAISLFSILLLRLFVRLEILELSYKLEEIRSELLVSDSRLRELKANKALRINSRRIEQEVVSRIGLKESMPQQIRIIN